MSEALIVQLVSHLERLQRQVDGLVKPEVGFFTQPELVETVASSYSLINGTFVVWQRGTSFAAAASGTYTADRWFYSKSGAMVHTITQDSSVPTLAQAGVKLPYSIKLDVTTADAAIAAGDICTIAQIIEGYNILPLAQREFTLSFWVRDTITGTHCVSFRNSLNDRSYVAEYTISVADTWEYKEIVISASPSAGTWNYISGIGLSLDFALAVGSTYHTTAGAWQTGNFLGTSNIVNSVSSTANNFYLAGIMITPGNRAATSIFIPDVETELSRCQRYYETQGGVANVPYVAGTAGAGGEVWYQGGSWVVNKRIAVTPTISGTWATVNLSAGPTAVAGSHNRWTVSSTTAAAGAWSYTPNSSDDLIIGNAEF